LDIGELELYVKEMDVMIHKFASPVVMELTDMLVLLANTNLDMPAMGPVTWTPKLVTNVMGEITIIAPWATCE